MVQDQDRSVVELRRESERTRAELTQTVAVLKDKIADTAADIRQTISPENIKAEVSDYVAEKRRHWIDTLKQQAMDNPMQAVAAGTAIALPALKLVRSVPLPLLMIGAGLALSSPRVRGAIVDKVSASLETPDGASVVDEARNAAQREWQSATARAEGAVEHVRGALEETRDAVAARVGDLRDAAAERVGDLKERAAGLTDSARDTLQSGFSAASEHARNTLHGTGTKAAEALSRGREQAETIVRDNAVWVGGIGLVIGALIASSLPTTRAERTALGDASEALRDRVAEAADETFDKVKGAAMAAANTSTEKIAQADLGGRAGELAERTAEKLQTVAEDAITTAFEPSQHDQH